MPLYIEQSRDLVGCHGSLTDSLTHRLWKIELLSSNMKYKSGALNCFKIRSISHHMSALQMPLALCVANHDWLSARIVLKTKREFDREIKRHHDRLQIRKGFNTEISASWGVTSWITKLGKCPECTEIVFSPFLKFRTDSPPPPLCSWPPGQFRSR